MKKTILILILLAVVTGPLFSQNLRLWGNIFTGIKLEAGQGYNDVTAPWEPRWETPTLGLLHEPGGTRYDPAEYVGAARFELSGEAAASNQGLVFRMRFNPIELYKWGWSDDVIDQLLNNCYIWFNLADNKLKLTAGIIRDSEWRWSEGMGFRLTYRPTNRFRYGLLIDTNPQIFGGLWARETFAATAANEYNSVEKPGESNNWANDQGIFKPVMRVLERTAIGGAYNHRRYEFDFGIKLAGDAFPMQVTEWEGYGWETRRGIYDFDRDWIGLKAGFGYNIKSVKNYVLEFGAEGFNLLKFNDYGWVQAREKIGYKAIPNWYFEVYLEQYVFGSRSLISRDNLKNNSRIINDVIVPPALPSVSPPKPGFGLDVYEKPMPFFHVNPMARYLFNDKLFAGLRIPTDIWPENVVAININPFGEYQIDPRQTVNFQYKLITELYDNTFRHTNMDGTVKPFFRHVIQINFKWYF